MGGSSSYGEIQYRLNYEVSPITLVNGIASDIPGGALGVVNLLLGSSFNNLNFPAGNVGLDTFGITFLPLQGSTVINNQTAKYPFANVAMAANAIINQPLTISMLMRIPATLYTGGHAGRASIFQALQSTLAQHTANEGTFVVNTPMFPWSDCILLTVSDVSGGESKQTQIEWKWDFEQPLISGDFSGYSLNGVMAGIASGGVTNGTAFGMDVVTGNPQTVASSPVAINNVASPGAGIPAANVAPQAAPAIITGPGGRFAG